MDTVLWEPSASLERLQFKARHMARIRDFFNQKDYLEVETPVMARYGVTDVYLENITASFRKQPYNLQTSPEYHMKRLLAAGSGPIFQLARVFRDDEWGRWHNPEFTMLEWYKPGIDHHALMDEMAEFLQYMLGETVPVLQKITWQAAFLEACDLDPFDSSVNTLKNTLALYDLDKVLPEDEEDLDQYFFLLMTHVVEPGLKRYKGPVAVYDYPPSQAALARVNSEGRAERFEIYYQGIELANGFHELTDYSAQKNRFELDLIQRKEKNLPAREADIFLLEALKQGLPACSGVALGVDRLLALMAGLTAIASIMAFDFIRA